MLLAAAAAIATIAAGCGGGDDSAQGSSVPLELQKVSKAEFVKLASKACREERADLPERASAYVSRFRHAPRPQLYKGFMQFVLLPTIEAETTRVRHLPRPVGEEESVDAALAAQEVATDKAATMERVDSLEAVYRQFVEAQVQFEVLGLPACANGPKFQRYDRYVE